MPKLCFGIFIVFLRLLIYSVMRTLILLFIFISLPTIGFAQYYTPYGQGMGTGVDRRIDNQRGARSKNKSKKIEKMDVVDATVAGLDKKLKLDDFQKAAIKVTYNEYRDQIFAIPEMDIPDDAKKEKFKELSALIDSKIMPLLSDDQKKKYQEIIDDRKF